MSKEQPGTAASGPTAARTAWHQNRTGNVAVNCVVRHMLAIPPRTHVNSQEFWQTDLLQGELASCSPAICFHVIKGDAPVPPAVTRKDARELAGSFHFRRIIWPRKRCGWMLQSQVNSFIHGSWKEIHPNLFWERVRSKSLEVVQLQRQLKEVSRHKETPTLPAFIIHEQHINL